MNVRDAGQNSSTPALDVSAMHTLEDAMYAVAYNEGLRASRFVVECENIGILLWGDMFRTIESSETD